MDTVVVTNEEACVSLPELLVSDGMPAVSELMLGGTGFGNLFYEVPEDQCLKCLEKAVSMGILEYDSAPYYGYGRSEEIFGKALLSSHPGVKLSTKVGRLIKPESECSKDDKWVEWNAREWYKVDNGMWPVLDYSGEGIKKSFEDSKRRMNCPNIYCLRIHDAETDERFDWATSQGAAVDALLDLRKKGEISAISLGMNKAEYHLKFIRKYPAGTFDNIMVSSSWNLLDHSAHELFQECQAKGVKVINCAVFGSGILWGSSHYAYSDVSPEIAERAKKWGALAEKYDVPLPAVALQFSFFPDVVSTVCIGCKTVAHVEKNVALLQHKIPLKLWEESKESGLLPDWMPIPSASSATTTTTTTTTADGSQENLLKRQKI